MPRPTDAKEPQAKGGEAKPEASGPNMIMLIAMVLLTVIGSGASSAASVYFLAPMAIQPLLPAVKAGAHGEGEDAAAEGEHGEGEAGAEGEKTEEGEHAEGEAGGHPSIGPIVDLDEFTVNLSDNHYLRADFSLMVSVKDETYTTLSGEALEKWEEEFKHEMGHYTPSVRDVIISSLTKRTSTELATTTGKEGVKKEILANCEKLFHGEHKVLSVNIENFIIQ